MSKLMVVNIILTIVFTLLWALNLLPTWWYSFMRGIGGYLN